MRTVYPEQTVRVTAYFRDVDEALFDPTSVVMEVYLPDGTTEEYVYGTDSEVSKVDVGIYRGIVQVASQGRYKARFIGTEGDYVAVDEETIIGAESPFVG